MTKCGLDYILECLASATGCHWAYLTEETRQALEARGFRVDFGDPHRLAKIHVPDPRPEKKKS